MILIPGTDEAEDVAECLCWKPIDGQELVPQRKDRLQGLLEDFLQLNNLKKASKSRSRIAENAIHEHPQVIGAHRLVYWRTCQRFPMRKARDHLAPFLDDGFSTGKDEFFGTAGHGCHGTRSP